MSNRVKWTGTLLICLNCSENKWWKGLNVADGQMHTLSHLIIRNSLPELITSLLIKKIINTFMRVIFTVQSEIRG